MIFCGEVNNGKHLGLQSSNSIDDLLDVRICHSSSPPVVELSRTKSRVKRNFWDSLINLHRESNRSKTCRFCKF